MTARTLADPMFSSIFNNAVVEPYDDEVVRQALINHGEKIMREHIVCTTATEEHSHPSQPSTTEPTPSTTILNPSSPTPPQPDATQSQIIQGVSGQNYAPLNTDPLLVTTPQETRADQLMAILQVTLEELILEINAKHAQPDLAETVSTALEQADWFRERIEDSITDAVDEKDFDYEIQNAVERYMRDVDISDHYDFDTAVKSFVEDEVESIIDGLVEEAVESRLADLLEEKLANAKITINF